ncbi:MAG: hypothetical protein HWQ41_10180 [Nostoc sp. NOS(2021)]|uniref:hypothetical protein n=1 Tax=Nostoc sp. NOS(2021) TaxID=2815407 RepID=UPI001E379049|nr:hypothetical protein [Nostoc sp. NOS(2021)]MBN3895613.1 hypothetical protein [Nostoc sp. NOS(2021)]MCC5608594.1 hypothetical protein [Nostoc sp. CHAB 5834]
MWQNFYKELSDRLFEKTEWKITLPIPKWSLPEIKILFIDKENINSHQVLKRRIYDIKLLKDIKKNNKTSQTFYYYMPIDTSDQTEVIKYIHIVEYDSSKEYTHRNSCLTTRIFINKEETSNIEFLSNRIIEEIPFKPADKLPKIF